MAKLSFIKEKLQDILTNLTFSFVTTNKGVLRYDGEDLEVGLSVRLYDPETETESAVEDGEYLMDDGRTLVVKDGFIEEIREAENKQEEPVEEEMEGEEGDGENNGDDSGDDSGNDSGDDPAPEPEPEPEVEEVVESGRTQEMAEEVENPSNEGEESDTEAVVKLREEVNELYNIVDELKARIEKLEGKPAAEPAASQFKNMMKQSGDDKLDKFISKYCK